eukprot:6362539-Amphidinium_carterae.1
MLSTRLCYPHLSSEVTVRMSGRRPLATPKTYMLLANKMYNCNISCPGELGTTLMYGIALAANSVERRMNTIAWKVSCKQIRHTTPLGMSEQHRDEQILRRESYN